MHVADPEPEQVRVTDETGCYHKSAVELVVRRLVIEDTQGRKRIEMAMQGKEPVVLFYDEVGLVRASLALSPSGEPNWVKHPPSG